MVRHRVQQGTQLDERLVIVGERHAHEVVVDYRHPRHIGQQRNVVHADEPAALHHPDVVGGRLVDEPAVPVPEYGVDDGEADRRRR